MLWAWGPHAVPQLSAVTTCRQSTWPPILFIIVVRSTLIVCEKVALGEVRVLHVPTSAQFADIFTKGLATAPFTDIRSSLNIVTPDVDTAGGVSDTIGYQYVM